MSAQHNDNKTPSSNFEPKSYHIKDENGERVWHFDKYLVELSKDFNEINSRLEPLATELTDKLKELLDIERLCEIFESVDQYDFTDWDDYESDEEFIDEACPYLATEHASMATFGADAAINNFLLPGQPERVAASTIENALAECKIALDMLKSDEKRPEVMKIEENEDPELAAVMSKLLVRVEMACIKKAINQLEIAVQKFKTVLPDLISGNHVYLPEELINRSKD